MRTAIVGSRRYLNKKEVERIVSLTADHDIIISGGCRGVDTWAIEKAQELGRETKIFRPNFRAIKNKFEMIKRFYERNLKVAREADRIIAFVAPDRKGGTENTIKQAQKLGKPVFIYD